ncbi:hypothetical protein [Miltoncostaea marina]|nr:hypothetical protein [Miltoncostaea marina]
MRAIISVHAMATMMNPLPTTPVATSAMAMASIGTQHAIIIQRP